MRGCFTTTIMVVGLLVAQAVQAADWPQYRYDASRSAASPEQLPESLHLQWVRRLPAPKPAFPSEVRLAFDATYEPVVLGDLMFVPSMVTDSLTALDTATGAERWRFFAEGPVRFAPVAWEGAVYLVSDDGCLYCLDAADGKLRWKFRQPAAGKSDRRLLGNGRLVSLWPARGGPVIRDGVLYFGTGLWSAYGVAVHAIDAASGRVVWSNAQSNRIPEANMDHGIAQSAGLTPHGYLAVLGRRLVVPCGAQLPAFLDPTTGALGPYTLGWGGRNGLPKGTWFVAGTKDYLSHSGDLYDIARPNDERFADPRMANFKGMLYPGGVTRVRIDPTNQKDLGAFAEPVFDGNMMYVNDGGLAAYDLGASQLEERNKLPVSADRKDDTYPDKWRARLAERWRFNCQERLHIKAGDRLYLGGKGTIQAVSAPKDGRPPQVAWRETLEGTPHRMIAARGRLFVVTREGTILAFGEAKPPAPIVHAAPAAPADAPPADAWTKAVADLRQAAHAADGFALVLGAASGRLVEEIVRQTALDVIVIERDAGKAASLRQRLHEVGLYGARASVHVGDPLTYPLPPYFAGLVAAENWGDLGPEYGRTLLHAVAHPLRPYGGSACVGLPPEKRQALVEEASARPLPGVVARMAGDLVLISRSGALPGAAGWTHAEADAGNTGASEDRFVKAPLELLWFDSPKRWERTGMAQVRVCGGRLFIREKDLVALDVFAGRRLWQADLPAPLGARGDPMVAMDDAVYVAGGKTCLVFDPATGRKTGQIDLPGEEAGAWADLRVWRDYLVGRRGNVLLCFHRRDGRLLWKHSFGRANLSVAVGGGKAFCSELTVKRPVAIKVPETAKTRALDLATGKLAWEIPGGSEVRYSSALDLVVLSSGIHRADDGSLLAKLPEAAPDAAKPSKVPPAPLCIVGKSLLFGTAESFVELDLSSGKPRSETTSWTRRGCTALRASTHLVTTRFRGNAACIDLTSREILPFWNVRAACVNNLFPADGVLNMPSLMGGCTCNYLPVGQGFVPAEVVERR